MFKENIINFFGLIKARPGLAAARVVLFSAFCAFIASCYLYWVNEGAPGMRDSARPMSRAAQSEGMRMAAEVLSAVLSKEAERVGADNNAALSVALNRVYPDLAESGYFVLWRGTVDVCSPLTPDTSGLDFGNRRDADGSYFVRDLADIAKSGGGFYDFALAYDVPLGGAGAPREFTSRFIAYSTPVQGTELHLTIWRPVDATAFSLEAELDDAGGNWSLLGLCMSGLSFLGVSVLLRTLKD